MTKAAPDERYKGALRDIVYELVDHAKHDDACRDFGYRRAMLYVLGLIKSETQAFELDQTYLCLAEFDPDSWFLRD